MFLDWQNTTKSLSSSFSCLFEEEIAEILKKFNGFLSYLQDRTAIQAHLAAIYCPVLVCPQKSHHGKLNFILYRINSQPILCIKFLLGSNYIQTECKVHIFIIFHRWSHIQPTLKDRFSISPPLFLLLARF